MSQERQASLQNLAQNLAQNPVQNLAQNLAQNLVFCTCGRLVRYAGEDRCEECYVNAQQKLRISRFGNPHLNVNTMVQSNREDRDVSSKENRPSGRHRH